MLSSTGFLRRFFVRCWQLTVPLTVILALTCGLFFSGYGKAAWIVSYFGTFAVVMNAVAYAVFHDSRARWPKASWSERLRKILTFQR